MRPLEPALRTIRLRPRPVFSRACPRITEEPLSHAASQSAFRSTPWAATTARPWSFPGAALALERHPDIALPHRRRRGRDRAAARAARRSSRPRPRSATPIVTIAWTRSRARRSGRAAASRRCGWRSRPCGTGEADAAVSAGNTGALMAMAKICLQDHGPYRAAGHRRHLADHARREHRARCRRHHRRRRAAPRRHGHHGRRHGAHRLRPGAADGRPAECRRRRRSRASRSSRRRAASCGKRDLPQPRLSRLRRGRRHRQGHRRRRRDRRLHRQHRAEDRRGNGQADRRVSARRHEPHPDGEARLSVRAAALSRRCATRWTRARSTAASSSAWRGSW